MTWQPDTGDAIHFEFAGNYVPDPGDRIALGGEYIPPEPEVRRLSPDFGIPWQESQRVDELLGAGWRGRRFVTRVFAAAYKTLAKKETARRAGWNEKSPLDEKRSAGWDRLTAREVIGRAPWNSRVGKDRVKDAIWDENAVRDIAGRILYLLPPARDLQLRQRHEESAGNDADKAVPWLGSLPQKDILHRTVWGPKYYAEICYRHYRPAAGGGLSFNLDLPISQVGDKTSIAFYFDKLTYDRRCSQREPSGWRDAYFYIKPKPIPAGLWSRVYVMHHSAFLTRLPDRAPIDITGMTIATDWDSLYWTLKAPVGSDAALALLEPTEDGPVLVEAQVNGHLWNFQVDRWTTGRSFGGNSRSIDGRSISAQLGAPTAEIRTYTEAAERTALQLMTYELENTGWSVIFDGLDDWLVPAGIHCYQDQTPMAVIKTIADTCRAIVATDMAAQTIRIKPRYKVKPWALAAAIPDIVIPASMTVRVDGEWDERPFFNAVHLSGEAGGISAAVTRQGSAGDLLAPMVTGKLITATEVARALGIAVLGSSGKWSKHRIELPVFAAPAVPGIIQPGAIIEYNLGASSWKGFVTAVAVTAPRTRDGLKVRQTIDVERYHGN